MVYFPTYFFMDSQLIASARGDTHPHVTGCHSITGHFSELKEALEFMKKNGVKNPKLVIKEDEGETTPITGNKGFYAVANGENPGIYDN